MSYSSVFFNRFSGHVHWWEYNEKGDKKHFQEKAPLYFYMKSDKGEYKSIYGDLLKKTEFDNYTAFKEAKEMYKAADRPMFESDIDIEQRFIMDKYMGKTLVPQKFDVHFIDIEVHSEKGFPKAELAEHPITVITVYSTKYKKLFIFSEKDFDRKFLPEGTWVGIFNDEKSLLEKFVAFVKKTHPDIISGWNSNGFDMPYIINRCHKLIGEDATQAMSPVRHIRKVIKKGKFGKTHEAYEIAGINLIDYLDLYRKYHQGEQESFKLNYIAKVEIGEEKVKFQGSLKDLYHNNWQLYIEYNVQDVMLIKKIDDRIKFMDMMIGICYNCRVPFDKFDKTTRVLDGAFISRLMMDKIILPDVKHEDVQGQYIGAYVKDPRVGMYDWVMSFDATSLYPSIMMQHNISPETKLYVVNPSVVPIVLDALEGKQIDSSELKMFATADKTVGEVIDEIKSKKHSIASNGAVYRHDIPGVVATFVKEWFDKRKFHKKLMETAIAENNHDEAQLQKGLQQNYKILINSVYGYVGSQFSRLYDKDNAVAVTATGQEVLKTTMNSVDHFFKEKWPNLDVAKKLNAKSVPLTIIYGDTDSVYCDVGAILKSFNYPHFEDNDKCSEFIDKKISDIMFKVINNAMEHFTMVRMNCGNCKIGFKREMIARRAAFLAKKRYIAWVMRMETAIVKAGDDHEIEAKGIEMVKSSTPEMIRDLMREFNLALMKDCDLKKANEFIRKIYDQFRTCDLEKIAKIMNVNGIEKYTGSDGLPIIRTPNHVKASIGYNMMLEKHGVQDNYEPIFEGDKVKILYIKNGPGYPYNSIAFKEVLPEEFGLKKMVDHDIMWEKVFIEPIKPLYEVLNWTMPSFDLVDITDLFS